MIKKLIALILKEHTRMYLTMNKSVVEEHAKKELIRVIKKQYLEVFDEVYKEWRSDYIGRGR